MNILLLRTKKGIRYAKKIRDALRTRGANCRISDIHGVDAKLEKHGFTPENTFIHPRTAGIFTNKKIAELEGRGFRVLNSSQALTLTNQKYLSQQHAEAHGIPVAKTHKIKKSDLKGIAELLEQYGHIVAKPIYSQGQGIYCHKISSDTPVGDWGSIIASIPGEEIQIQAWIDYQKLIRVIVIDFKALKEATTYDEPTNHWKCSVCLNPNIKHYTEASPALFELAEKTAKAFDAHVNYIDFFEDRQGNFILNEINTACSLILHEEVTGVAIHEHIAEALIHETRRISK